MSRADGEQRAEAGDGALPAIGWALVMLACVVLVWSQQGIYQFGGCRDDSKYFLLARSFARGKPYGLHLGPAPVATPYPFLMPLLLAPFAAWFPEDPGAGTALCLAFTLLNVSLLFWGWPRLSGLRSRWWGLAACLLYAVSPLAVALSQMLNADSAFTAVALITLMASEACARRDRFSWPLLVGIGFLLASGVFLRSAGIALVAGVVVRLAWHRRREWGRAIAGLALGALLLLLPVLALTPLEARDLLPVTYSSAFLDPASRGHDAAESWLPTRVARGLGYYVTVGIREGVAPLGGGGREEELGRSLGVPWLPRLTSAAVCALIAIGALWSSRGALTPSVLLFQAFHLALHLVWHHRAARFLDPVLPFLALQLLWGVRLTAVAALRLRPSLGRAAVVATVLLLACGSAYKAATGAYLQSRRVVRDLSLGTTWLRHGSAPGDVVLAEEPATVRVYSDRRVVPLRGTSESAVIEDVARFGVRYVLIAPDMSWSDAGRRRYDPRVASVVLPLMESWRAAGRAQLVYESAPAEMVRLYRVE